MVMGYELNMPKNKYSLLIKSTFHSTGKESYEFQGTRLFPSGLFFHFKPNMCAAREKETALNIELRTHAFALSII